MHPAKNTYLFLIGVTLGVGLLVKALFLPIVAGVGIFFLMTGAALSHAFANDYGDYGFHIIH